MLFNSPLFVIFFVVVFCLYWVLRARGPQNVLLLVASYVFYGAWSWKFLALLWFITLLDYTCGGLIASASRPQARRALLIASIVINLGLLGVFKYLGFFVREAATLLQALGIEPHVHVLEVVLPVGISFYTFQSLGYVVDVYRGKFPAERSLPDYALYVAFFPQLLAGPIGRAGHLLPQIKNERRRDGVAIESGLQLAAWGLLKKVVVADNLAPYVDAVYRSPGAYSAWAILTATIFFAFQIYCDVSGYSDTARGTARMLGFDLAINFDLPYFSGNPVEFWRRWHISLSRWFQDYLYDPLAMHFMRKGSWGSKYRAHIISMTLIGLWHGANWTFILFGLYWGLMIAAYLRWTDRAVEAAPPAARSTWLTPLQAPLSVTAMFAVSCFGWMLFRAGSLGQFWSLLHGLGSFGGESRVLRLDVADVRILWMLVFGMWLAEYLYRNRPAVVAFALGGEVRRLLWRQAMILAIVFSYVVSQETHSLPFIYFQF
jgi:alginate O-acetyltransferase complex protein AlgI